MSLPITLKDITIYPVVEQQGAFFDVMEFFPTLNKDQLDENRSWRDGRDSAGPADSTQRAVRSGRLASDIVVSRRP